MNKQESEIRIFTLARLLIIFRDIMTLNISTNHNMGIF